MLDERFSLPEHDAAPALYARFWTRASAFLVDFLIFSIPAFLFVNTLHLGSTDFPAFAVLFVLAAMFYCVPFESSRLQATPGKWLFGLQVTDIAGERITVPQATIRYLGKLLSALILGMGFQMMESSQRRQTLHDRLAGTCVVQKLRLLALREGRKLKVSEKLVSVTRGLLVIVVLIGAVLVSAYVMHLPASPARLLQSFCGTLPMEMNQAALRNYVQAHDYRIEDSKGEPAQVVFHESNAPAAGRCIVEFKDGRANLAVYKPGG